MPLHRLLPRPGVATAIRAGLLSAALYGSLVGVPPTDPTTALSTAGASGTYQSGTGTVTSTLDGKTLQFDWLFDIGHGLTTGKELVSFVVCPGFAQAKATITTEQKHRQAGYTAGGRAALIVVSGARGRIGVDPSDIDACRDAHDLLDISRAAAAIAEGLGAAVLDSGDSFVPVGYSTGGLDVLNAMCRLTDHVMAGVCVFPNWSLRKYWYLSASSRAAMTTMAGDLGTALPAEVDPYRAREGAGAISNILAMPNGPLGLWVCGDRDEAPTVPITDPDELVTLAGGSPAAAAKVHAFITSTGDAARVLHGAGSGDVGPNGSGAIASERRWMGTILANAAPWSVPVAGRMRVLGWTVTRRFEVWTDLSASDCKSAATGGKTHALDLDYDVNGRFEFNPLTSQNGKIQVKRGLDDRRQAFTAGGRFPVDFNEAPTITTLADLGASDAWFSDAGTTGGGTLTSWVAEIGGRDMLGPTGEEPAVTTVSGKSVVRITRASVSAGKRLAGAFKCIDPANNYTMLVVYSLPAGTAGQIVNITHQGSFDTLSYGTTAGSPGVDIVYYRNSAYAVVNGVGGGGHNVSTSTKHFAVVRRSGAVITSWLDMGQKNESTVTADTFPSSGTFHTEFGAGLADSGNPAAPFEFQSVDLYGVAFFPRALSEVECLAAWNHYQDRFY